jgi:hypothetical protein
MTQIQVNGLKGFQDYLERLPDIATQAAVFALNDVGGGTGLTMLRDEIYDEIEFPKGYLNRDRLGLAKRASTSKLEAVIRGRDRPTSLARFAKGASNRRSGVQVRVKPGSTKTMSNAWLVPLRSGNTGLAIRLKPGESLNKRTPPKVKLAADVYLLYGPSVDQVLSGVATDNSDKLGEMVSREFLRQIARLTRG